MAETSSSNVTIDKTATTDQVDQVDQAPSAVPVPKTCASKNCIHKPESKLSKESDKKSRKKKKSKKVESDSDSSDSDESDSSASSSDSEEESSHDDSSSEDENSRNKRNKSKTKKCSKKTKNAKRKSKSNKSNGKKNKKASHSGSESEADESSSDESSSDELATLTKELESSSLFKGSKKRAALLKELIKLSSKVNGDNDTKKTKKTDNSTKDKKAKKGSQKDTSKPRFKRLDEIWDEDIYDYRLKETSDQKKKSEWDKYMFTVRRKFNCNNHYQSTQVEFRSVPLIECLKVVMEGVSLVSLVDKTPRLTPHLLFMYLEDFREYRQILKDAAKACDDQKIKKSLKLKTSQLAVLIAYLDKDFDDTKKTLYPMLENGTITFDFLWYLYKPNMLAYKATYADESQPLLFKIDFAIKEKHQLQGLRYTVEGKHLDFDGDKFGWAYIDASVMQFPGTRKITSLTCYPLKYHQNPNELKARLIEQGKKFLSLCGMRYRYCKGMTYVKKDNKVLKINSEGRVMIDPKTFRRINPNYALSDVVTKDAYDEDVECRCEKKDGPPIRQKVEEKLFMIQRKNKDDQEPEVVEMTSSDERAPDNLSDPIKRAEVINLTFTEEEVLCHCPLLPGFSLSEKMWVEFAVSTISDVKWNEEAFDSLVIPDKHKSIVKALVSAHGQHASKSIDDVVAGKGKGLVAVLHGKPGLGKTLTCEAVADHLKRPLYAVSAGDLGTHATQLEIQLQTILDVAYTWKAVLLLDEADVFLEARSSFDVSRNGMVSVFLRILERFEGILFLTTNRVGTFDEAFVSRIHLSLRYGELTLVARKAIWKTFITKVGKAGTPAIDGPPSTATSDTSSTGMPTPETTSSTPNSGRTTPVPPAAAASAASPLADSADNEATETSASTVFIHGSPLAPIPEDSSAPESKEAPLVEKFTEANYVELARVELNGRQIKNLVCTAQALALHEGVPLGMAHLRRCIEVGRSFENDLKGGRGWEDVMRSYT